MIGIIDYGLGNLRSVQKALNRVGVPSMISHHASELSKASHLILPGVGHFKKGMENLHAKGLIEPLNDLVLGQEKPILGICLGMQLMTQHSEEGDIDGLGWIPARTLALKGRVGAGVKVPHMGWNDLNIKNPSPWWNEQSSQAQFYFVHSYYVLCDQPEDVVTTSDYGLEIVSSFKRKNVNGAQFHPEKSHDQGLKLLYKFYKG